MPKLLPFGPKKLIAILKKRGFKIDHTTGSHYIFYHPLNKRRVTVPYHRKDIPRGTLLSILKEAGITKNEL